MALKTFRRTLSLSSDNKKPGNSTPSPGLTALSYSASTGISPAAARSFHSDRLRP